MNAGRRRDGTYTERKKTNAEQIQDIHVRDSKERIWNEYETETRRIRDGYGTDTLMRRQHAPTAAPGASARSAAPADAS